VLAGFFVASPRGRARLAGVGPWIAFVVVVAINVPQILWLQRAGVNPLSALPAAGAIHLRPAVWVPLMAGVLLSHAGFVVMLLVAGRMFAAPRAGAPVFERQPIEPFARRFVYTFALAPLLVAMLLAAALGNRTPLGGTAPLVLLSGLAIVVAAGDTIRLYRERTAAAVWLG